MSPLLNFLIQSEKIGLKFPVVYDIGANIGAWSKAVKQTALPNSQFYLFEAVKDHESSLASTGFPYFLNILSNPEREYVEFYQTNSTGDSYYRESSHHFDNIDSKKYPCTTLDKIIKERNLPIPNLIKIDTQGSELDILSGAKLCIGLTELIYIECPIIRYNEGAPTMSDYIDFFTNKNYLPIDIFEVHRGENILLQVDILFMRKDLKEKYLGKTKFTKI